MDRIMWLDFGIFVVLLGLFFYLFAFSSVTKLHRVYLILHSIFITWPLFQFVSMTMPDPRYKLFYLLGSYVALTMMGFGWLAFIIFLTGQSYVVRLSRLVALALPALGTAVAVACNPGGLFLSDLPNSDFYRQGPIFWLMAFQLAAYVSVTFAAMLHNYRKEHSDPHRKMIRTALIGLAWLLLFCMADLLANVVLLNRTGNYIPFVSLGLVVVSLYLVNAITRHKAFDIIQIAQRDVMNTMQTGIIVLDEHDAIVEMNKTMRPFSGLRIGDKFSPAMLAEELRIADKDAVEQFFETQRRRSLERLEMEVAAYMDEIRYIVVQSAPILNQRKSPIGRLLTFQDVTELRLLIEETNSQNELLQERNRELIDIGRELSEANKKLEHMAVTDSLTGSYNRRFLMQQLEHEVLVNVRYGIPFSLVMFDIDLFKSINDAHGHLIGDEVLRRTVEAVRVTLRETDILARYGGEEFTVYLPHTMREQADRMAEEIKEAVERNRIPIGGGEETISVTISIGVVSMERPGGFMPEDPEAFMSELLAQADSALYEAKFSGRNRIVQRKLA